VIAAVSDLPPPRISVEEASQLKGASLDDLCEAAELAIRAEGGFGWITPPAREIMERYWRGVLAVPERTLFMARLDGVIAGSIQLVRPPRNNEAQAMAVQATTAFLAPWARGLAGSAGGAIAAGWIQHRQHRCARNAGRGHRALRVTRLHALGHASALCQG
jgi:hypothetical protein